MLKKYYQDELAYLRDMGKEFACAHPEVAHMLAYPGTDPDVERLLEGVAFITGNIREKLDDDFPELTHSLMGLLCPHYLSPIPSMSILEFEPTFFKIDQRQGIARGTEVLSIPVEGTKCRFKTSYHVDVYPMKIENVSSDFASTRSSLDLEMKIVEGVDIGMMDLKNLNFYLHGEPAYLLYLLMTKFLENITIFTEKEKITLGTPHLKPMGFKDTEGLLPYPEISLSSYRILQEYFSFPLKFFFMELSQLGALAEMDIKENFTIRFNFSRSIDSSSKINKDHIRLYCTPVVNLFTHESDPIRVDSRKTEYLVRPSGVPLDHMEIYSIDSVSGWQEGNTKSKEYKPFFSFNHSPEDGGGTNVYHHVTLRNSATGKGTDTYLSFITGEKNSIPPDAGIISVRHTATNSRLAEQLRVGDIRVQTDTSPEFARFKNICGITPTIMAPIGNSVHWRLISHLSLNYLSLTNVESLRTMLELYDFKALYDRQAERINKLRISGIENVSSAPVDLLFKGTPVRGTDIKLEIKESHFNGEGDMVLFGTVLNEFFARYVTLNSFSRLTVRGTEYGETYLWPVKIGEQKII